MGHEDDLRSECTFHGTREEPPEYDAFCPECDTNWENMDPVPYCASCGDKFVKNDGDNCVECIECIAEDAAERRAEDRMTEART
jgi:hypothetical protein